MVGAVSEEVAIAMVEGALARARVQVAVAITGVAGPGGGSPTKPVGLVHLALARTGGLTRPLVRHERCLFGGDRDSIRNAAATVALRLIAQGASDSTT